ncbi:MAG: toxic anion resistance protein, partial [Sphingomonas sp.]|nr:toxic anion resistance protein [Sphingomonas sp.]
MATATETVTETLKLTPPDPVPVVAPEKAAGLVPVDDATRTKLDERVDTFIADLVAQDVNSPEFGKRVDAISAMGQKEIREAAGQSNRFLDRPVRAMDQESGVGADLASLRRTIEDLDPAQKMLAPKKLFGIIPFGNSMRNYFDSYKSSQTHISSILKSLSSGKDELLMDNAAIDTERANLWTSMGRLEQMILLAKTMDTKLEDKANELDHTDPAKAK